VGAYASEPFDVAIVPRRIGMRRSLRSIVSLVVLVCCAGLLRAQASMTVELPAPQMEGGMPLMEALKARCTTREFAAEPLSKQELSNLLWAAFGINRPDRGLRTAPSAMNRQEIDIYVAMADGLYLWDAKANTLNVISAEDLRAATGRQPFVKEAPVNLVFVADFAKMGEGPIERKNFYSAADAGYISENVYLYCASAGLATVVRGSFDRESLEKVMNLRPDQRVVLTQTVGHPKK
jgi:SagB-type dehydrogenase family enzyme